MPKPRPVKEDVGIHKPELTPDVVFKPHPKWTAKQREFLDLVMDPQVKAILVRGPAGTSKTILAVYAGLLHLDKKRVEDILYLRSVVESASSHIGFLPGTVDDKLSPYGAPLHDKLEELLTTPSHKNLTACKVVNAAPINFIRGSSWRNKFVIADEAQNFTHAELRTILTRLGEGSKIMVLGDPFQSDIPLAKSGFDDLCDKFSDAESQAHGVHIFEFTEADIVRSAFCKFVCSRLD